MVTLLNLTKMISTNEAEQEMLLTGQPHLCYALDLWPCSLFLGCLTLPRVDRYVLLAPLGIFRINATISLLRAGDEATWSLNDWDWYPQAFVATPRKGIVATTGPCRAAKRPRTEGASPCTAGANCKAYVIAETHITELMVPCVKTALFLIHAE